MEQWFVDSMELFSRRRWTLVVAKFSTKFGYWPSWAACTILQFSKLTAYHLGRYEPSSPFTKELHDPCIKALLYGHLKLMNTSCTSATMLDEFSFLYHSVSLTWRIVNWNVNKVGLLSRVALPKIKFNKTTQKEKNEKNESTIWIYLLTRVSK